MYCGSLRNFRNVDGSPTIGKYTYGDFELHWFGQDKVNVGNFCSIGGNNKLYIGGNHKTHFVTSFPFGQVGLLPNDIGYDGLSTNTSKGPIEIGSDVWFGDNCVVMSGVKIGHGAVIANSSVVTKDVLPYQIVGGVPSKHIKMRFEKEYVDMLLRIKWWDWSDDKILENKHYLYNPNIKDFVERFA